MTVCIPPAITHQPTGQQVNANASATLTVTATSSQTYWVRVSGGCGSVDSTAVAVDLRPVIVTQPQSGSVGTNQTMTLSVTATGSALHYQWYRGSDSSTPVGTDAPTYTTGATAATNYWVKVSSGAAFVASTIVTLTPCGGPAVTGVTQTAAGPGCKLITVNVSSGDAGNVTYFWYKGASGDTTHPLGGGPNYLTACPTASTQYWCRVTFNDGTCSTDTTAVTVTP